MVWNRFFNVYRRVDRVLDRNIGGTRLEVLKFGMYIMFPIGWMYYFGVNLDNRFSVPDFWPKPETTNRIPFEREDIEKELQRLKSRRLRLRDERLAAEAAEKERMESSAQEKTEQAG